MITIVAKWEKDQLPPEIEWQLWRQIKGAFGVDQFHMVPITGIERGNQLREFATIEEALEASKGARVFLEPKGEKVIDQIPDGDIVLVLGDTFTDNMALAEVGEAYHIRTPGRTVLYGTSAAAIALAVRAGR